MLSSRNEDNSSRTIQTYLGLVAITVLAKIIFILTRLDHPLVKQGVFSWIGIIVISALGFIAVVLAPRAGFPDMWNGRVSNRQRFIIPMLVGCGLAMIEVLMDALFVLPETPTVNFPFSIPAYFAGGILSEILLHLIPVVLLMWIIGAVILRGKWQAQVFWVVAAVISLLGTRAPNRRIVSDGLSNQCRDCRRTIFLYFCRQLDAYLLFQEIRVSCSNNGSTGDLPDLAHSLAGDFIESEHLIAVSMYSTLHSGQCFMVAYLQ